MVRLDYQTKAGKVSKADTFMQLIEHLRLAQECCLTLAYLETYEAGPNHELLAQGYRGLAQMYDQNVKTVTDLATGKLWNRPR